MSTDLLRWSRVHVTERTRNYNSEELEGATFGVTAGSTTELNLADTVRAIGIDVEAIVYEETETLYQSYDHGRCDVVTSDKSQLLSRRQSLKILMTILFLILQYLKNP